MRSGLIFAFVFTSGIIALSLLLLAGGAAEDTYSQRTYAAGDLILRADRIWIALWDEDVPDVPDAASNCAKNEILLKEGYTLALDGVYHKFIPATEGMENRMVRIANFSLYRDGEIVKKASVAGGDFFYYNMTADGREYPVIEFRVDPIFATDGVYCSGWLIPLMEFNQYSDGAGMIRLNLTDNPAHLPPSEEWNMTISVKIGSNGEEMWERKFGGRYDDTASIVQKTGDGGYFLLDIKDESRGAHRLIRTDPIGNEIWNRTLAMPIYSTVTSLQRTDDNGCIIAGTLRTYFPDFNDAMLLKLDANGSEEWNRTLFDGGGSEALDVLETGDGYVLAGRKLTSGGNEALLVKTDLYGNTKWSKTFGGERDDEALSVQQTKDAAIKFYRDSKIIIEEIDNICL